MDDRTIPLDAETKVAERPHDHKDELDRKSTRLNSSH